MWHGFDELYARLSPDDWPRPYGRDWTFADQPFHLAYFDRVMFAEPLEAGADLPEAARWTLRSARDIDTWNDDQLARRPAGQTPEQSVAAMGRSHERIKAALDAYSDADLDRAKVFSHFFGLGFVPLRALLEAAGLHTWSELSELRFRLGVTAPEAPAPVIHRSLRLCLLTMAATCRPERATRPFTVEFQLAGPGGGTWALRVADGACTLAEAPAARPDLVIRMAPDTLNLALVLGAINPLAALLRGQVRVVRPGGLPRFLRLFPRPAKDQPVTLPAPA